MKGYPFFVIKLINPRDNATVGYWNRGKYIPVLHNKNATRFDSVAGARGIALGLMPDHDFGIFMAGWRVKPLLQIIKVM